MITNAGDYRINLKIMVIDSDQKRLEEMADAFRGLVNLKTSKVDRVLYLRPPAGLDAIFLVLPAAERWGSKLIPGEAQILRTGAEDQQEGMPPFVVTGVVLRSADPRGPLPETKLLISTALEAVRLWNETASEKINNLGFWAVNLLNGVTPVQLAEVFSELL
jgi:hypothetical protein